MDLAALSNRGRQTAVQARPTTRRSWRCRKLSDRPGRGRGLGGACSGSRLLASEPGGLRVDVAGCRCVLPPDGLQLQRGRRKRRRMDASRSRTRRRCSPRRAISRKLKRTQRQLEPRQGLGGEVREGSEAIREGRRVDGGSLPSGETEDSGQAAGSRRTGRHVGLAGVGSQGSLERDHER